MGDIYDTQTWLRTDPRLQYAFLAMAAEAPGAISVGSGWRSHEQQTALHREKPNLAAAPGKSNHEYGLAIDMTFENAATRRWVHANAARFGLWFPMDYEPWHVQLMGVDRHNVNGGKQIGGGRDAFSMAPDGRFVNPYDAMAGYMQEEDPYDPMTQFQRLIAALTSPDGALSSPEGLPGSPGMVGAPEAVEDVAGMLQQGAVGTMVDPNDMAPTQETV